MASFVHRANLLTFGLAALAMGPASAQSSFVRIYGLSDIGVLITDHAPSTRLMTLRSNGMNGNRLGVAGKEDLGGGLAAVYTLEMGWNGSTGALAFGSRPFGSQSFVGLMSTVGTLLAGRQVNVDVWTTGLLTAASRWSGLAGTHPGDNDNFYNTFRVPNALKYVSPRVTGFQFQGLYSLGETSGSAGSVAAVGATYDNGPLRLAASASRAWNPNIGLAAGTANVAIPIVSTTNFFTSPIVSGYASARSWDVSAAGMNYTIGKATLGLVYSQSRFDGLGDLDSGPNPASYFGSAQFRNWELSAAYKISPSWLVAAQYVSTNRSSVATISQPQGSGEASYRHGALSTRYNMSSSAFLYAVLADQRASGIGSTNTKAVAHINGGVPSSVSKQRHLNAGIQLRF